MLRMRQVNLYGIMAPLVLPSPREDRRIIRILKRCDCLLLLLIPEVLTHRSGPVGLQFLQW